MTDKDKLAAWLASAAPAPAGATCWKKVVKTLNKEAACQAGR